MAETSINLTSRFRQRKINLKQHLRVYKQSNLPDNAEDVRGDLLGVVDTGVDKNEEDERHLQAVLSASTSSFSDANKPKQDAFIPTPLASKKWTEYKKFYTAGWSETDSYIRSSATVEDAQGNTYNMDEADSDFLEQDINAKISDPKQRCSEEEFEMICSLLERVVSEKQPFLSTDPTQLMSYEELEPHVVHLVEERRKALRNPLSLEKLLMDSNSTDYAPAFEGSPYRATYSSLKLFGPSIYKHWRQRKIEANGKSIFPSLRYETGLSSDETDPYVCFRHREVRQSRKTRRTDQQNIIRIRKLHSEMQSAKQIFDLVLDRERTRLSQIQSDFEIFELRCRVKALKRKLKIGPEPDDVELMVSSTKRARQEKQAQLKREAHEREKKAKAAQEKIEKERERREQHKESSKAASDVPAGAASTSATTDRKSGVMTSTGSRIPDLDHVTVEQQFIERDMAIEKAINNRLALRQKLDKGWINVSDTSQLPAIDVFNRNSGDFGATPFESQSSITGLRDEDYVGSERRGINNDEEKFSSTRLQLPFDALSMPSYEPPELLQVNSKGELTNYGDQDFQQDTTLRFSVPRSTNMHVMCRKRKYGNLDYIDRLYPKHLNPMAKFQNDLAFNCSNGVASEAEERLHDRFKFDADHEDEDAYVDMLLNDPAKLNQIDPTTQNLRFSSMLTTKAIEFIHEAAVQRRKIQQTIQRRQQIQLQQRAQAEAQAQRNAQMQAQSNIRMQQAQRTMQRQQQRRQKVNEPNAGAGTGAGKGGNGSNGDAGGNAGGNAGASSGGTAGEANPGSNNGSNGNNGANNGTNGSNATTKTSSPSGNAPNSANPGTNQNSHSATPPSSENKKTGSATSSPNLPGSTFRSANVTPQPPKLEAGG